MKQQSKTRWLNSTVLGIGLASLFSDLSHEAVTSVLPALLATMGVAAGALGTIEGIADGASSVAKLYGGVWADRLRHRKPLCAAGYGVMAASVAVIAMASSWIVVLTGRTLAWVARGIRTPARKILLSESVTPEAYGRAFGLERTMDTLGAVIAPLAATTLLALGLSMRNVIWLSMIPALLAVGAIMFLVHEKPQEQPRHRPILASLKGLPRGFGRFLAVVGIFGAGDFAHSLLILYAVTVLTPIHGVAFAATASVALYTLHNVVYAGISYPAGHFADRWRKPTLLAFGYFIAVVVALLLMFGGASLIVLAIIFALAGAYVGIEETLEDSLAAVLLPKHLRGTGFGTLAIVNGIGDMISSITVGWLWAAFGSTIAFGFAGTLMLAGAISTAVVLRNVHSVEEPAA